jgi:hypothetical protein
LIECPSTQWADRNLRNGRRLDPSIEVDRFLSFEMKRRPSFRKMDRHRRRFRELKSQTPLPAFARRKESYRDDSMELSLLQWTYIDICLHITSYAEDADVQGVLGSNFLNHERVLSTRNAGSDKSFARMKAKQMFNVESEKAPRFCPDLLRERVFAGNTGRKVTVLRVGGQMVCTFRPPLSSAQRFDAPQDTFGTNCRTLLSVTKAVCSFQDHPCDY